MQGDDKNIRVVAVFPEIHPRINDYDRNLHKFVGQCVSEDARSHEIKDDPEMQAFMDLFPSKNSEKPSNDLKLIYISLGTIFHLNTFIFEMIIEAIRTYNHKSNRKSDSSKFRVVMSVGGKSLAALKEKASKGEIILPKNILFRARVPQLSILERAHLFVTHSGMNSTNETIKYAVPIVSIPIEADQPVNAKQMCDVLQLGVRLDPLNLSVDGIADAIDQVLNDEKYAKNIKEMSIISAKYNGRVEGAKIIVDYLNQDNKTNPNLLNNPNKIKPY
jgi:MGT family glycosyltransferase